MPTKALLEIEVDLDVSEAALCAWVRDMLNYTNTAVEVIAADTPEGVGVALRDRDALDEYAGPARVTPFVPVLATLEETTTVDTPSTLPADTVALYGWEAQLRQLGEEMSELFVVLNHMARGRHGRWNYVADEVADVRTLLDQVPSIVYAICEHWDFYCPSPSMFDRNVDRKLRRNAAALRERLAEEEDAQ